MPDIDFWLQRWEAAEIGFHEGTPNAMLSRFIERLGAPGRVLVPFCGKAADLGFLASQGWEVVGVEVARPAAEAFFSEHGLTPTPVSFGEHSALRDGAITIVVTDWFSLDEDALGPFDAVYDRAALIAVEPDRRQEYVNTFLRLSSHSRLRGLLVTLEHDGDGGPPFSVVQDEVLARYADRFVVEPLAREPVPTSPSLQSRGASAVTTCAYALGDRQ